MDVRTQLVPLALLTPQITICYIAAWVSCPQAVVQHSDIDCNGVIDYVDLLALDALDGGHPAAVACSGDCNGNETADALDITNFMSYDCNLNGVPDECELPFGDVNCSGGVNLDDILCVLSCFGGSFACAGGTPDPQSTPPSWADLLPCGGGNYNVNLDDILAVLQAFGGTDLCA